MKDKTGLAFDLATYARHRTELNAEEMLYGRCYIGLEKYLKKKEKKFRAPTRCWCKKRGGRKKNTQPCQKVPESLSPSRPWLRLKELRAFKSVPEVYIRCKNVSNDGSANAWNTNSFICVKIIISSSTVESDKRVPLNQTRS